MVVRDAACRTGQVFSDIIQSYRISGPRGPRVRRFGVSENVVALTDLKQSQTHSNLDYCVFRLEAQVDLWTFVLNIDPRRDFGHRVSRPRLYISEIPMQALRAAAVSPDELEAKAVTIVDAVCAAARRHCANISLDDMLLPEEDPLIQDYLRECRALPNSKPIHIGKRKWCWGETDTV